MGAEATNKFVATTDCLKTGASEWRKYTCTDSNKKVSMQKYSDDGCSATHGAAVSQDINACDGASRKPISCGTSKSCTSNDVAANGANWEVQYTACQASPTPAPPTPAPASNNNTNTNSSPTPAPL